MYVLELAVQGVRGFAQNGRIALKPGYLVLRPQAPGVPLCGLVTSLCFADGRGGDSVYLAPGQKAGKAGLSLVGNDGLTYRIVRELGGSGALHRLNKASGQFEVVTQDAAEAAQFLRSQVGVPAKTTFEQVFCFSSAQLPTQRPKPKAAAAPAMPKPALPQLSVAASADLAASEARLIELQKEFALSSEVDQLQFRLDGVSRQIFDIEAKLKGGDGLKAAIKEAEEAFAKSPTAESLGVVKDIASRAEHYPQLVQRRDEALAKLELERQEAEAKVEAPRYVEPVWRDMRFVAGVVGGFALLILGSFLEGYARYLALLDIAPFGFAAWLALRWVDDLKGLGRVGRVSEYLANKEEKIREEFNADGQAVREAIARADVETTSELIELLARKPLIGEKIGRLRDELAQFERDTGFDEAAAKAQQLNAEYEEINQQLLEKGGYLRDVREVEREIARTKESIAKAKAPPPPAAPAAAPAAAVPAGPTEVFEDPMPALLLLGADLLATDLHSAAAAVRDRCVQYLTALTDRRYSGLEFDQNGKAFVQAAGRRIPAGEMPGKDLDLLYVSARLTLIEKHCAKFKVPILFEELPTLVDAPKLALLGRMLKHVGTMTQVVHVTSDASLAGMADLTANV